MHPHTYIKNDRVTSIPQKITPGSDGKKFWHKGSIADDFRHIEVLDRLTDEAVRYANSQTRNQPFFLYSPLTAPHKPIIPERRFQGRSGLNEWGDFVMQVDWTIGQVMRAMDEKGFTHNTLFIVASDNGATPGADFALLEEKGHDPSYKFRGHKADIFKGGHRVAFVARWPVVISGDSSSDQRICHTNLLATVADITGFELSENSREDSVSILPLLTGRAAVPVREATIHHSINGSFAIRRGHWKLCLCPGLGGWSDPRLKQARKEQLPAVQLYGLSNDIAETRNLQTQHPEIVAEFTALLQRYVQVGAARPVGQNSTMGMCR